VHLPYSDRAAAIRAPTQTPRKRAGRTLLKMKANPIAISGGKTDSQQGMERGSAECMIVPLLTSSRGEESLFGISMSLNTSFPSAYFTVYVLPSLLITYFDESSLSIIPSAFFTVIPGFRPFKATKGASIW